MSIQPLPDDVRAPRVLRGRTLRQAHRGSIPWRSIHSERTMSKLNPYTIESIEAEHEEFAESGWGYEEPWTDGEEILTIAWDLLQGGRQREAEVLRKVVLETHVLRDLMSSFCKLHGDRAKRCLELMERVRQLEQQIELSGGVAGGPPETSADDNDAEAMRNLRCFLQSEGFAHETPTGEHPPRPHEVQTIVEELMHDAQRYHEILPDALNLNDAEDSTA